MTPVESVQRNLDLAIATVEDGRAEAARKFPQDAEPASNSPADLGFAQPKKRRLITYEIPPGTPERRCRSCEATIYWIETLFRRSIPRGLTSRGRAQEASRPERTWH
ncbi:MAG: hypothetical protein FWD69_17950 [Polyangiaceae bacterium]|nr:hypothetical protein [Polyangiaceae bacterium]